MPKLLHRWDSDKDTDTDKINPVLVRKVLAVVSDLADHGYTALVTDGYRTKEQQAALFRQGRSTPGPIVTSLRIGMHCSGLAADLAFVLPSGRISWSPPTIGGKPAYALYGHLARVHGLVWGGDWKGRNLDEPHVQLCSVADQGRVLALLGAGVPLPSLWEILTREGRIPK